MRVNGESRWPFSGWKGQGSRTHAQVRVNGESRWAYSNIETPAVNLETKTLEVKAVNLEARRLARTLRLCKFKTANREVIKHRSYIQNASQPGGPSRRACEYKGLVLYDISKLIALAKFANSRKPLG